MNKYNRLYTLINNNINDIKDILVFLRLLDYLNLQILIIYVFYDNNWMIFY